MITFAIPFYKNATLLRQTLESVTAQTSDQWRVIVCDDGGQQEGRAVVEAMRDPRMQYHANPQPLGMVGNWNACLDRVETSYATLLHADDTLLPTYTAEMLAAWERHPGAALLFCRARVIDAHGKPVFSFPDWVKTWLMPAPRAVFTVEGDAGLASLLRGCYIFCPTVCFRRAGGFAHFAPWKQVQDLDLWARLLEQGAHFVGLPFYGYAYRRHAANATALQTQTLLRFEEEALLYSQIAERAHARGWVQSYRTARQRTILKLNLLYCAVKDAVRFQWAGVWAKGGLLLRLSGRRVERQLFQNK